MNKTPRFVSLMSDTTAKALRSRVRREGRQAELPQEDKGNGLHREDRTDRQDQFEAWGLSLQVQQNGLQRRPQLQAVNKTKAYNHVRRTERKSIQGQLGLGEA